jgi:uncharacterized protein (DUF885 family)
MSIRTVFFYLFAMGLLIPCFSQQAGTDSEKLAGIIQTVEAFELYDKKEYPLGRFEEALYKKNAEFAGEQLSLLRAIRKDSLSETEQISLELMQFTLQDRIDEYTFKMYLNPLQADQGFHLDLNYKIKPILNYSDAKAYLNTLNAIPLFTEEHFTLLRKGLKEGLAQPKVVFKGYEATYNDHIVEDFTKSEFYQPFENLPDNFSSSQRDSILKAAKVAIEQSVVPSFKKIRTFFETEYLPNTRDKIGVSEVPGGRDFYQNRIDFYTTSKAYTADDIHNIGIEEVARIRAEMEMIIHKTGFKGSFGEFLDFLRTDKAFYASTGDQLLKEARNIAKKIDGELPKLFKTLPRKPYGVKKVPDAIAPKYTGGRYSPASGDEQPGFYLVNTYKLDSRPLYVLPSLTAHEAVPGHHLQMALNSELGDSIPAFRKDLYLSAYGEGWALYSEFLGNEMGIYTTPYEEFGKLTYEMWRACRLVVDTGIHARGWSRQKAVDYMLANTALSEHEVNTETDRYIAWPGQAISYKIGELKIREMRKKAEQELGSEFDIREFHEIILEQGTVTMPILEKRITAYLKQSK